MNSPRCAGVRRALKTSSIESTLHREKKNPVSNEILIQVASISILGFWFFKVIRLKENIFSALGPPNTEQSCSESCFSAWSLPKLLASYFPFGLIIPPALKWIVLEPVSGSGSTQTSQALLELGSCWDRSENSLILFPSLFPHCHHIAFSCLNKSCPSGLVSTVCF